MPALDFADVYFNTDKVESSRFWIASTPFFQAFLVKIFSVGFVDTQTIEV